MNILYPIGGGLAGAGLSLGVGHYINNYKPREVPIKEYIPMSPEERMKERNESFDFIETPLYRNSYVSHGVDKEALALHSGLVGIHAAAIGYLIARHLKNKNRRKK